MRVVGHTSELKIRVAQNTDVGTPNIAASNAGLDTLGWTDLSPEIFDIAMTDEHEQAIQASASLTRPVLRQARPN